MKHIYLLLSLLVCILTGCNNKPVPDLIMPWTTTYTGGIDFLKEKGGEVTEGRNIEGMWKYLKSVIGNDTVTYFFSNPENKLLIQFISIPKATPEQLVEYYAEDNEIKSFWEKFHYVKQDIQTIFIGPQKTGAGLAIVHNCPQLSNVIEVVKNDPIYKDVPTVESLGLEMFIGIIASLSYGIPPMEEYYLESMPTTIHKQSTYLMQQYYQNQSRF